MVVTPSSARIRLPEWQSSGDFFHVNEELHGLLVVPRVVVAGEVIDPVRVLRETWATLVTHVMLGALTPPPQKPQIYSYSRPREYYFRGVLEGELEINRIRNELVPK